MKYPHYILFFIASFTIISCKESEEKLQDSINKDPDEIVVSRDQFNSNNMQLGSITAREFPEVVQTTGEINVPPGNRAVINAFVGGYVKHTSLLPGDKVKKGQALVTLENPEYVEIQQQYLEVAEQLNYLKAEFERQQTLLEEKVTSEKRFLQAQSDYRRNLASYNGLRQKLKMLNIDPGNVEQEKITSEITIYAPISGSITAVDINRGMFVSPMDRIMEIVNNEHMHLELIAFEKDAMSIEKGQEIIFSTPEAASEFYNAEVHLVGTAIDPQSRTISIHGHLPDSIAHRFAVGMFVQADLVTSKSTYMALPEEAVITQNENSYVLQLQGEDDKGYIFKRRSVELKGTYNGFTGLSNTADYNEKDRFLINGSYKLLNE